MRRTACVDVAALPLQLLLRERPEWRRHPVVVVDRDHPRGRILHVDERAARAGIAPGMRYAAALSTCGSLRAAEVSEGRIAAVVDEILRVLLGHSPSVEPAADEPGVFWLDATGLEQLYESLRTWADRVHADLARHRLGASVVVGFRRFGVRVLARARRGAIVLGSPEEEEAAARRVSIERLGIAPRVLDDLWRLGVRRVDDFLALPADGLRKRFGKELHELHRLARGDIAPPLAPARPEEPLRRRVTLEGAEADLERLVRLIRTLLEPLLIELDRRDLAAVELEVLLELESRHRLRESLRPAAPTTDAAQLTELVRLRLQAVRFREGVVEVEVALTGARSRREQLELFAERPPRDLRAADRALARLRAELGEDAVVRARLREGHLPEASFVWEPIPSLPAARPLEVARPTLVRRFHEPAIVLPPRPRHEPDGWMLRGLEEGPVDKVHGPFVVAGGWWRRAVRREYHYAETRRGDILWVYFDRIQRRWHVQGRLE